MRLTVHTLVSLDGVMQGPGGPQEDTTGGFGRGGWLVPYADEGMGRIVVEEWFAMAGALLLGRTTFELFRAFWPQVTDPADPIAAKINGLPRYVASTTIGDPAWEGSTVLGADALERIAELKRQDGEELQVHGSCGLVHSLHDAGLVDEYRVLQFPVVLGEGKKLFRDGGAASGFTRTGGETTPGGLTYLELTPAPFATGDITVHDGKERITT